MWSCFTSSLCRQFHVVNCEVQLLAKLTNNFQTSQTPTCVPFHLHYIYRYILMWNPHHATLLLYRANTANPRLNCWYFATTIRRLSQGYYCMIQKERCNFSLHLIYFWWIQWIWRIDFACLQYEMVYCISLRFDLFHIQVEAWNLFESILKVNFSINTNSSLELCPSFAYCPRCVFEFDSPTLNSQGLARRCILPSLFDSWVMLQKTPVTLSSETSRKSMGGWI